MPRNFLAPQSQNAFNGMGFAPIGARYASTPGEPFQAKGLGYFGPIKSKQGDTMTELSFAFDLDGQEVSAPLLVPTLDKEEVMLLQSGGRPTDTIYRKAYDFAMQRMQQNRDTFAQPQELRYPAPR